MAYLRIDNLMKSYGSVQVISGLSFSAERGSFLSLLGPSGSGKTTILRCIAGLELPGSGQITLGDEVLSGAGAPVPPEHRGMGMVFQNYAVWPHLTVFENVAFPLRIRARRNRPAAQALNQQVGEALSRVRLGELAGRFPHELSGGQQQRVALARALVATPRLLLLDEPLSNLDALLREELGAEIRRLQKDLGLTAILVTHDQKEALALSDRIIVLDKGRIAADGTPEALYNDPPSEFVAEFLAGGQRLAVNGGAPRLFLPRRWRVTDAKAGDLGSKNGERFDATVVARIYRGSEYEYLARVAGLQEPVRFFSPTRLEAGAMPTLVYEGAAI